MAIAVVMLVTRAPFYWTVLLTPAPIFFLLVFCCGMGMILAALAVYFRDVTHLWGVVTLAWTYCTPIFYSVDTLPGYIQSIMKLNPMYHYLNVFRNLVMYGNIPGINAWIGCVISAVAVFLLGLFVFGRMQKRFILHI